MSNILAEFTGWRYYVVLNWWYFVAGIAYIHVILLQKYAKYVGVKRDFRLVVRGAARNMVKILNGSGQYS